MTKNLRGGSAPKISISNNGNVKAVRSHTLKFNSYGNPLPKKTPPPVNRTSNGYKKAMSKQKPSKTEIQIILTKYRKNPRRFVTPSPSLTFTPTPIKKPASAPLIQPNFENLQKILANHNQNGNFGGMTRKQIFAKIPTQALKDPKIYSFLFGENGKNIHKSIEDKSLEEIKRIQNTYTNTLDKITTPQAQLFENQIIKGQIRKPIQITNSDTSKLVEFLKNKANRIDGKTLSSLIAKGSLNETKLTKNELSKIFGVVQLGKNTVSISNLVSDEKNKEILKNAFEQTIAIRIKEQKQEANKKLLSLQAQASVTSQAQASAPSQAQNLVNILRQPLNGMSQTHKYINTEKIVKILNPKNRQPNDEKIIKENIKNLLQYKSIDADKLATLFINLPYNEVENVISFIKIGKTKSELSAETKKNRNARHAKALELNKNKLSSTAAAVQQEENPNLIKKRTEIELKNLLKQKNISNSEKIILETQLNLLRSKGKLKITPITPTEHNIDPNINPNIIPNNKSHYANLAP